MEVFWVQMNVTLNDPQQMFLALELWDSSDAITADYLDEDTVLLTIT